MEYNHDFAMERRLRLLSPDLHKRFADTVFALQFILSNYKLIFPDYTDHSELHSLSVIDFCNTIIGDRLEDMNADEIYCLLVGCYFHDTGMGIAKYADLFDIPSPAHFGAIIQIARGHRKTDLTDTTQYPISLAVPNGNTICLPYLAAIIRLADEIDVTAARNSHLLFDLPTVLNTAKDMEYFKHEAVKEMVTLPDRFVVYYQTDIPEVERQLGILFAKMQQTLDICRAATNGRTPYTITQKTIEGQKI